MAPAFSTVRQAAAFGGLLLALISAPSLVARAGLLNRAQVYPTIPVRAGPFEHVQQQIFEAEADLDVAFVGSSFMWAAIDAPYVQEELSALLGRQARVTVLASVWPGLDRDYVLLRDLLSRRRVGLVVLQFPNRDRPTDDPHAEVNRVTDAPHVQAFRFYRVGDFPEIGPGLARRAWVSLYAGAVLGMPRHLLSLLRPNYTQFVPEVSQLDGASVGKTLGARFIRRGYYGAPYEEFRPPPPAVNPTEMIFSQATASSFRFFGEPPPAYQMHFLRLIGALLRQHGVPAVVLHIPQANEAGATTVEERIDWLDALGAPATLIGIPPARLFAGLSGAEIKRFYGSDHLNENGLVYFTRAVMPAFEQVFAEHDATQ